MTIDTSGMDYIGRGYDVCRAELRERHGAVTFLCGIGAIAECFMGKYEKVEHALYSFNPTGLNKSTEEIRVAQPSHTTEGELEAKLYFGALNTQLQLDYTATSKLMDLCKMDYVDGLEGFKLNLYRDQKGVIQGASYVEVKAPENSLLRKFDEVVRVGRELDL